MHSCISKITWSEYYGISEIWYQTMKLNQVLLVVDIHITPPKSSATIPITRASAVAPVPISFASTKLVHFPFLQLHPYPSSLDSLNQFVFHVALNRMSFLFFRLVFPWQHNVMYSLQIRWDWYSRSLWATILYLSSGTQLLPLLPSWVITPCAQQTKTPPVFLFAS
jgi:hypothetical protein